MTRQEYEKIYSRMTKLSIDSFIRDDSTILSTESDVFDEGYTAEYTGDMLEHFKSINLHMYWFWKYPDLFDRDDLWSGCAVQRSVGNHFGEWLGSIILNHHFGYDSLVEKYDCPNEHKKKASTLKGLVGTELFEQMTKGFFQGPDLLLHKEAEYFFCEVKRRNTKKVEKLTERQPDYFKSIKARTGKKIILLSLIEKA